ncbi:MULTISPECIES: RNA polymerase sigma factor [unclassified Streptomyces]|uniref:RNA polymerase sigma factor n=1 Tax=unclassified Streptomyces TaxID=2593676 RepID=UPI0022516466|nr:MULTISPECIES: RNA polymerase sigma factor [unclassified Streptomyces]MCX4628330.1 RNA polymerase sigma factor [Streptomyces sp. NBC_01443]WSW44390.1 RNA polymerase sigma factor [Streptomyces sp. NBC_01001]
MTPAERDRGVALARAARAGDTLAMHDLLEHLTPYIARICTPIALVDGPDACQEALVAVFRALRALRDPETLYGWVRAIAVREAVRTARRAARARPAELADLPGPGDPELAADIDDVLARLSPDHQAVLVLRDVEGLDEESAAALLGVPPGTAKSRLHRARTSFRRAWSA